MRCRGRSPWRVARPPLGGYDGATRTALVALAVAPSVLGRMAMNHALPYPRAYEVNVSILGKPIRAALRAALPPGGTPTPVTRGGGGGAPAGSPVARRRRLVPGGLWATNP